MKSLPKVTINEGLCKGCGLCVAACPKNLIAISKDKINNNGFRPAVSVGRDTCKGCAFCATMCPHMVIEVE